MDELDSNAHLQPQYRLRLFLSVDLVGSTAYKSDGNESNLTWIKAFQKFYGRFPELFAERYTETCSSLRELDASEASSLPKVWKTIGDEILFVNRVHSLTHLCAYITAFRNSLIEFGAEIRTNFKLDTKGNAWIAAFPNPNRSIQLSTHGSDALSGKYEFLTEELEALVDKDPRPYDFLGKGIDGGFRISRNSNVDAMTVSPALAYLLCQAKNSPAHTQFDCKLKFHEPQTFKGVIEGKKYPVISIETTRNKALQELDQLESTLLGRPIDMQNATLTTYLEKYISIHNIESPVLKVSYKDSELAPPQHYTDYIKKWKVSAKDIQMQESAEVVAAQATDNSCPAPQRTGEAITSDQLLASLADLTKNFSATPTEPV